MLQKVKFYDGNDMVTKGEFTWDMLAHSGITTSQTDIRFTLYDFKKEEVHAILFDVDHCSLVDGISLARTLREKVGEVKMYHVYTGGGHHIYVPLEMPLPWDDVPNYKKSYAEFVSRWEHDHEPWKDGMDFDKKPFNPRVYGRVPGAINSKHNKPVRFIREYPGECLHRIEDILEWRHVEKKEVVGDSASGSWNPAKFCGVIDYVGQHEKVDYNIWKMAMGTLAAVGDMKTALEINNQKQDEEVKSFFKEGKPKLIYQCVNVPKLFEHSPDTPCYSCPHYQRDCSPAFVSGRLPTPHAMNGFNLYSTPKQTKEEKDQGIEPQPYLDPFKIAHYSVVNHWINLGQDKYITHNETLYEWIGTHWDIVGFLTPKDFPYVLLKELKSMIRLGIRRSSDMFELIKMTCYQTELPRIDDETMFDDPRYINLKNGVLNLESLEVVPHDKEFYMRGMVNVVYDPDAECPVWYKYLDHALDEEGERLLQVFMGLAISSIKNTYYQQYLWLKGYMGTGKSKTIEVLQEFLGDERIISRGPTACFGKEGGVTFDFRGKTLFFIDDFKAAFTTSFVRSWEGFINIMTTGLKVAIRDMYSKIVQADPTATIVISSNFDPPVESLASGTLRRVRLLNFYKVPPKIDLRLMDKLKKEMPGILNWMITGLDDFHENGMPEIGKAEQTLRDVLYDDTDDIVGLFCRRYVVQGRNRYKAGALYQKFLARMDVSPDEYTHKKFGKDMRYYLPTILRKPLHDIYGRYGGEIWYNGIALRSKGGNDEDE